MACCGVDPIAFAASHSELHSSTSSSEHTTVLETHKATRVVGETKLHTMIPIEQRVTRQHRKVTQTHYHIAPFAEAIEIVKADRDK
jgi:hypothetical protein